jgi:hypothetical protein
MSFDRRPLEQYEFAIDRLSHHCYGKNEHIALVVHELIDQLAIRRGTLWSQSTVSDPHHRNKAQNNKTQGESVSAHPISAATRIACRATVIGWPTLEAISQMAGIGLNTLGAIWIGQR